MAATVAALVSAPPSPCPAGRIEARSVCSHGLPWTAVEKLVILMTMPEVSSLAEAKAHLSELVARVGEQHERITVTVHGRPTAVLLAVDDLESLEETIAVLSDSAALRALGEADAELARGEGENQESLAAAMQARRART
jgi:antitoxin YefM